MSKMVTTDIEFVNNILRGNKFFEYIGMEAVELEENRLVGRVPFSDKIVNPRNTVHGGVLYAIGDTVGGALAECYGRYVTTINGNFSYMLPACDTEYIYCEAKILRYGMHIAVCEVSITNDKGTVLNSGSFSYFILDEKIESLNTDGE